jgi:hypothetical protein
MSEQKSVFKTLSEVPIKDKVESKGKIDYLSWAYAWSFLKQNYPTAQRIVYEDPATGWNYFTDGRTAWVKVGVEVDGLQHIDYLPIMDNRNSAIPIEKVNQFDVNKAIQRSTAKAIAMHGLGLQLWTGEDIPSADGEPKPQAKAEEKPAEKVKLEKGDENWEKVVRYVEANKTLSTPAIVAQLERKYELSKIVIKEISQLVAGGGK